MQALLNLTTKVAVQPLHNHHVSVAQLPFGEYPSDATGKKCFTKASVIVSTNFGTPEIAEVVYNAAAEVLISSEFRLTNKSQQMVENHW